MQVNILEARGDSGFYSVVLARVLEAIWQWSVQVTILEVRADSGFYRVLLKLLGMHTHTGSQGYSVLLA